MLGSRAVAVLSLMISLQVYRVFGAESIVAPGLSEPENRYRHSSYALQSTQDLIIFG